MFIIEFKERRASIIVDTSSKKALTACIRGQGVYTRMYDAFCTLIQIPARNQNTSFSESNRHKVWRLDVYMSDVRYVLVEAKVHFSCFVTFFFGKHIGISSMYVFVCECVLL